MLGMPKAKSASCVPGVTGTPGVDGWLGGRDATSSDENRDTSVGRSGGSRSDRDGLAGLPLELGDDDIVRARLKPDSPLRSIRMSGPGRRPAGRGVDGLGVIAIAGVLMAPIRGAFGA